MKNIKVKNLVYTALFTALVCAATMVIHIPTPRGYINIGDSVVLMAGWILGPIFGSLAAGLGSMLADIISGYIIYAPGTFIIKALMAFAAYHVFNALSKKTVSFPAVLVSTVVGELIMFCGYILYETIIYQSLSTALLGVPGNLVQGSISGVIAVVVYSAVRMRVPAVNKQ